jgi:hypothetical protein
VADRAGVLLVANSTLKSATAMHLGIHYPTDTLLWVCNRNAGKGTRCGQPEVRKTQQEVTWEPYDVPIDYCLSEQIAQRCRSCFSTSLMYVVLARNLLKLLIMLATLRPLLRNGALLSVGDAIYSYLRCPDVSTKGLCMISASELRTSLDWQVWSIRKDREFLPNPRRRFAAAS